MTTLETGKAIGARKLRKEDPRLLRGEGCYVADIEASDALHAAILRSPHAHARLGRIDASRALATEGVVAVLTGEDIAGFPPIPVRVKQRDLPELDPFLQPALARGKVRYVGDPVAAVVAVDRYLAEDALDLIDVEYEPLPAVVELDAAAAQDAPLLVEEAGSNLAMSFLGGESGDVDAAFADADVVVSHRFSIHRHAAVPLETRGLVARYDAGTGRLTVWGPTKVPHFNRALLSELLGLEQGRIHFVEPDVGGGFGARGEFYPEDLLVPLLAMRLRRAVKWVEDRREALVATNHSREQTYDAELALTSDGRILGLRARLVNAMGAYVRTHGRRVSEISANNFPGPYRIPSYRCDVELVVTNKTPTGTYRTPGRFEANFVRERLVDMAARELGLDPVELRRRNFVTADEMPYEVGTYNLDEPVTFDSGDPPAVLARALELIGYDGVPRRRDEAAGRGRRLGVGIAAYMEESGLGGPGNTPGEYAKVAIELSGTVVVYSGVAVLGQGLETTLSQICADELGVDYDRITVVHGDTDRVPFGGGTWADRGSILGGSAVLEAARLLRRRLRVVAGRLLEVDPEDVEVRDGEVVGPDGTRLSFAQLAGATYGAAWIGAGETPGLEAATVFRTARMSHGPGADVAIVEIDPETGVVEIVDHVIVYDVGRALNPAIVEGQIHGGAAQGIGGAFLEEFAYDDAGQPLATSFMDYLLPGASEIPRGQHVEVLEEHPSPLNPLGIKGAGEVGPAGAGAAFANAVADALGDVDAVVDRLPLTPSRVLAWLETRSSPVSLEVTEG